MYLQVIHPRQMVHPRHFLCELEYNVWVFPGKTAFQRATRTISENTELALKVGEGCHSFISYRPPSCYLVPGVNDKKNRIIVVFTYCSAVNEEAVSKIIDLMKNHGGKELTAEEIKHLIILFSYSVVSDNSKTNMKEHIPLILLLKQGNLGYSI